jgi:hypothetical protein
MTITLHDLTVEAITTTPDHYDVTSIRDLDGHNVPATPELLDEIEALLDAEAQARRFDDAWLDCEMPHLLMPLF